MRRSLFFILFTGLCLTGCGIKGPLYLPPDPNDSYLSRIEQELNDMTGTSTATEAPIQEDQLIIEEKSQANTVATEKPSTGHQKEKKENSAGTSKSN